MEIIFGGNNALFPSMLAIFNAGFLGDMYPSGKLCMIEAPGHAGVVEDGGGVGLHWR